MRSGLVVGATALGAAGLALAPERPVLAGASDARWMLAARAGEFGPLARGLAQGLAHGAWAQTLGAAVLALGLGAAARVLTARTEAAVPSASWTLVGGIAAPGVVRALRGEGPDVWLAALVAWATAAFLRASFQGPRVSGADAPADPDGARPGRVAWGVPGALLLAGAYGVAGPPAGAADAAAAGFGAIGLPLAIGAAVALLTGGAAAFVLVAAAAGGMALWPDRTAAFAPLLALAGADALGRGARQGRMAALPVLYAVLTLWTLAGVRRAAGTGGPDPRDALALLGANALRHDHDHGAASDGPPGDTVHVELDASVSPLALQLLAPRLRFVEDAGAQVLVLRDPLRAPSAWRALLPPPTARLDAGGPGFIAEVWDRPLPLPAALASADASAHHPRNQRLWTVAPDGAPVVTDLAPASSASVVRLADGAFVALYVREQALWRAVSADGVAWTGAAPLGVAAFDPAPLALPDGRWRVLAVEAAEGAAADPARAQTRFVSFLAPPDLSSLEREPGERLAGVGLVDPAPALRPDGTYELLFTEGAARVGRATSADGLAFTRDAAFVVEGATVPAVASDGSVVVQYPLVDRTGLFRHARRPDGSLAAAEPLEVCGTGASLVGDRLFWTDAAQACGPPYVRR